MSPPRIQTQADATPTAWPDVRPQNGYCLPRDIFIPHIDRILTTLGIPVESRTSMITAWLPSLMRHKNIVGAHLQYQLTRHRRTAS
jgi:hypothetical protein